MQLLPSPVDLPQASSRLALRRAITLPCEVVSLDRFHVVSEWALDVSQSGLLVEGPTYIEPGESMVVRLQGPGDCVVKAEAVVARVVRGLRQTDEGSALGLRFVRASSRSVSALLRQLKGTPPPIPARRVRVDYASAVEELSRKRFYLSGWRTNWRARPVIGTPLPARRVIH